jgi:tryptophanyl-tRNA synthetase
MSKKRVLSGVQPTGSLHLGNYLGAIRNWVTEQSQYENYFFIADLHAITVPQNPQLLKANTYYLAALYIACGLDHRHTTIFVQSHIPAHTELAWLLNCVTPLNWLERMIQFKEKSIKQGEEVSIGLLDYPVLQAADILLYDADLVPVGEDQKQHLELTRDIAARVNFQFGQPEHPILKIPDPLIRADGARVMSLTDGTKKMSKSDPSEYSRINLLDSPQVIQQKVKRCKTDAIRGLTFDDPERPECHNLLSLYMLLSGQSKEQVASETADMGWGQFKPLLTETIIESLKPIQERYHSLTQDQEHILEVLRQGAEKAEQSANKTLKNIKDALGFSIRS